MCCVITTCVVEMASVELSTCAEPWGDRGLVEGCWSASWDGKGGGITIVSVSSKLGCTVTLQSLS